MTRFKVNSRSRPLWSYENCTFPTLSPLPFIMAAGKWPLILKLQHNIWIWSVRIFDICSSLTAVRPQKSFSDFNETWYVDKDRWVMHDRMPYDPSKVKVTSNWKPLKRSRPSVPHRAKFCYVTFSFFSKEHLKMTFCVELDSLTINVTTVKNLDNSTLLLLILCIKPLPIKQLSPNNSVLLSKNSYWL